MNTLFLCVSDDTIEEMNSYLIRVIKEVAENTKNVNIPDSHLKEGIW